MDKYKMGKRISDGAFGTVYEAQVLDQPLKSKIESSVAIKQVYTSSNLQRELSILKKVPKNDHIIQIYQTISDKFMTNIVMERGQYDLSYWIQMQNYPISQNIVKNLAFQILLGLSEVHRKGIIHRDLKPSNLIIRDNGKLAICDFGSAVQCTRGQEYEIEGFTRWYKCPQMLFGYRRYKYEADIWSVGCIIAEIATGQPLFNGKSEIEQLAMMAQFLGDPSVQNWPSVIQMPDYNKISFKPISPKTIQTISTENNISIQLTQFIKKMVRYQNRPSTEQLLKDDYFIDMKILENIEISKTKLFKNKIELLEKAKKFSKI